MFRHNKKTPKIIIKSIFKLKSLLKLKFIKTDLVCM